MTKRAPRRPHGPRKEKSQDSLVPAHVVDGLPREIAREEKAVFGHKDPLGQKADPSLPPQARGNSAPDGVNAGVKQVFE